MLLSQLQILAPALAQAQLPLRRGTPTAILKLSALMWLAWLEKKEVWMSTHLLQQALLPSCAGPLARQWLLLTLA